MDNMSEKVEETKELKPCPKCGSTDTREPMMKEGWYRCDNCGFVFNEKTGKGVFE